ncbi:MAG: hypothetical protein R3F46_10335 [bacterium]
MIQHLDNWLAQYRTPFWEAIYLDNNAACQASLQQARDALANAPFSEDERQALGVYVDFMQYQLKHYFAANAMQRAELARGQIVSISMASRGPLATVMEARCSLTQRCWAHAMHGIGIPRGHVDRFFGQVPEEDRDHQLMNYLSFWAFAMRDLDYMEQSYRYFLLVPVEFMVDFSRQRVKVMQAALRLELERHDLLRLIELMHPPPTDAAPYACRLVREAAAAGAGGKEADQRINDRGLRAEAQRTAGPPAGGAAAQPEPGEDLAELLVE